MTGGGPGTATTLLSFQIWKESFSMYDFGAGSAVAFIVVAISARADRRDHQGAPLRPLRRGRARCRSVTRSSPLLGALLILLFTGGPVLLAFVGSVVPDRVMFAADRGLFDEVTLENYRYIFTGELPPAYLQIGRQPDDDLGRRPPGAAEPLEQRRRSPSPRWCST